MKISVVGCGYVGLVSAAGLADLGHTVFCIDKDPVKIAKLRRGESYIHEDGLEELLAKNGMRIFPGTGLEAAVKASRVIFIAVETPFGGKRIDLAAVRKVAEEIGDALKTARGYRVVVVKSTVIPYTTLDVVRSLVLKRSGKTEKAVGFCMNPEFLREGSAVRDFMNPDRIVFGVTSPKGARIMRQVYAGYRETDIVITNPMTAEMVKYTANAYLALNISFANEIARICEKLDGVDSEEVFRGVVLDKRISPGVGRSRIIPGLAEYLRAGCGFGGSCFPKDVAALASFEKELKVRGGLLEGLLAINQEQVRHIFEMGVKSFKGKAKTIAVLGTAFKPDTDDVRESPGVKLIGLALKRRCRVFAQDYLALENTRRLFGDRINYSGDPLEAAGKADVVFVATRWARYLKISDRDFERRMKKNAVLIDCRSLYKGRPEKPWRRRVGVGRPFDAT